MPLLVLVAVAVSVGFLVFALTSRYPTPVAGEELARAAGTKLGEEAVRRRWLAAMLRKRLDPTVGTGLALTLAATTVVLGGLVLGVLAYLVRTSTTLARIDNGVGQWGADHSSRLSMDGLQFVTDLAGTWVVVAVLVAIAIVEYARLPNRWMPVFLLTVLVGELAVVNTIKYTLDRVRPTFNLTAATLGPSFPSGHTATAAAFYAAVALVLARRRSPGVRALLAGSAAGIAAAVATSRVMLGVHWLSDVIAGVAFGWAWFAICAIGFGGRVLTFGAPIERARTIAERETTGTRESPVAER